MQRRVDGEQGVKSQRRFTFSLLDMGLYSRPSLQRRRGGKRRLSRGSLTRALAKECETAVRHWRLEEHEGCATKSSAWLAGRRDVQGFIGVESSPPVSAVAFSSPCVGPCFLALGWMRRVVSLTLESFYVSSFFLGCGNAGDSGLLGIFFTMGQRVRKRGFSQVVVMIYHLHCFIRTHTRITRLDTTNCMLPPSLSPPLAMARLSGIPRSKEYRKEEDYMCATPPSHQRETGRKRVASPWCRRVAAPG